jgi:hypothetical protein
VALEVAGSNPVSHPNFASGTPPALVKGIMRKPRPDSTSAREALPIAPIPPDSLPLALPIEALEHSRSVIAMLRMEDPPQQITAALLAITIGHLRIAEQQLLVQRSSLGDNRWRTALLALADARRELECGAPA